MERHSRRSALLHLVAVALLFLGYGVELLGKLLDLMAPQLPTIHGAGNATLEPLTSVATGVVGAEGHAEGHATVRGYTLVAQTGVFTMRVREA